MARVSGRSTFSSTRLLKPDAPMIAGRLLRSAFARRVLHCMFVHQRKTAHIACPLVHYSPTVVESDFSDSSPSPFTTAPLTTMRPNTVTCRVQCHSVGAALNSGLSKPFNQAGSSRVRCMRLTVAATGGFDAVASSKHAVGKNLRPLQSCLPCTVQKEGRWSSQTDFGQCHCP